MLCKCSGNVLIGFDPHTQTHKGGVGKGYPLESSAVPHTRGFRLGASKGVTDRRPPVASVSVYLVAESGTARGAVEILVPKLPKRKIT